MMPSASRGCRAAETLAALNHSNIAQIYGIERSSFEAPTAGASDLDNGRAYAGSKPHAAMGRSSMRIHTSSLLCAALIVFLVGVAAAQSALQLDGKWEGTLAEKGTMRSRGVQQSPRQSPVVVRISTASDGTYDGEMLLITAGKPIPDVVDIGEVTIDGDAIRIDVPSHGVWQGKLSSDGLTLAGEWRQGSKTTPLVLRRTGNADEPVTFSSFSPGTTAPR